MDAAEQDALDAKTLARINQAQLAFTGKVARTSIVTSDLGLTVHELEFTEIKMLRGKLPPRLTFLTRAFDPAAEPHYPKDATWLVATSTFPPSGRNIDFMAPATDRLLSLADRTLALPLGWTLDKGRPLSPWAALGDKAWPKECAGRQRASVCQNDPPRAAGRREHLSQPRSCPPKCINSAIPSATANSRSPSPTAAPTLPRCRRLSDGKRIRWEDSLVVVDVSTVANYGMPCLLAGAGKWGTAQALQPVVLKPNQSISTIVDVLQAKGVLFQPGGAQLLLPLLPGRKVKPELLLLFLGSPRRPAARHEMTSVLESSYTPKARVCTIVAQAAFVRRATFTACRRKQS